MSQSHQHSRPKPSPGSNWHSPPAPPPSPNNGKPGTPPISKDYFANLSILVGNSNPELGKRIAKNLNLEVTPCVNEKFYNSEIRIQIKENIRRRDVVIIQTGAFRPEIGYSINDFLMEILILANACRLSSVDSVTLVCPCFPYARQDKKDVSRTPISGRAVADLLQASGISRLITLDLHASQIAGFFSIPVDNLYTVKVMAQYIRENYQELLKNEELVLVSPDAGGVKRMDSLAQRLEVPTVIMHKIRDHLKKSVVKGTVLIGEQDCVKDKSCIIIDDMVDTAGTICNASQTLVDNGAKDIRILVVHGILSGPALDRLNERNCIKEVIVTNSLPQEENLRHCPKLRVIDVAPLLAEAIRRLYSGESISELFN